MLALVEIFRNSASQNLRSQKGDQKDHFHLCALRSMLALHSSHVYQELERSPAIVIIMLSSLAKAWQGDICKVDPTRKHLTLSRITKKKSIIHSTFSYNPKGFHRMLHQDGLTSTSSMAFSIQKIIQLCIQNEMVTPRTLFKRKASFDIFMLFFLLLHKLFNIFLAKSSKNAQEVLSSMLHLSSLYSLYPPTFYSFRNFF